MKAFSQQQPPNGRQQVSASRQGSSYTGESDNQLASADNQDGSNGDEASPGAGGGGTPEEEDEFECPNNGIFADEASGCQAYHVCQSGAQVQQKFQCPMGTLFNNIILTCDFAHNVQCNKAKNQQQAAQSANQEARPEPIYRQPQPPLQQEPRASLQVNQNSYVRQPQQQASWQQGQQRVQQSGPKQLEIGQLPSQYTKHQQRQSTSREQAVSAYPPAPVSVTEKSRPNNANGEDNSDEDDSAEPLVPLVPATLPPRAAANMAQLPYNPPPQPSMPPHQSAHRSQYPSYQPNQYDVASAATPVFASRDESELKPTEPTNLASGNKNKPISSTTTGNDGSAQAFNLVINHVTPTQSKFISSNTGNKQHQKNAADLIAKNKHNQQSSNNNKSLAPQVNSQLVVSSQVVHKNNNKETAQLHKKPSGIINNKLPNESSYPRQQNYNSQRSDRTSYDNHGSRQPQATQAKSVHVDRGQQLVAPNRPVAASSVIASSRPSLVDMTNGEKSGVSSDTLNDGLLLIVRHGEGSNPLQVGLGSQLPSTDYKQPISQATAVSGRASKQQRQHSTASGQAYAVDPSLIRPNSPDDAMLFPNVQRVLAAQQSQPAISHQAAQSSHYIQHAVNHLQKQQQQQHQHQKPRVSPPLAPLEPPKPTVDKDTSNELPAVTSPSSSPAEVTSSLSQSKKVNQSQHHQQHNQRIRVTKRTKRLRAAQAPLATDPSMSSS